MSYERLTHYRVTPDYKHECVEPNDGVGNGDIYNRLAELEDKLESGELVGNGNYRMREENGFFVITQYRVSQKYICSELTKEAAEARLKELLEGKK